MSLSKTFFNMETGEDMEEGHSGMECWMADDNLWIAGNGVELAISGIPLHRFCDFLEQSEHEPEYMEMYPHSSDSRTFNAILEYEDEGRRNLCFWDGRLFFDINMKSENILAMAKFLREYRYYE